MAQPFADTIGNFVDFTDPTGLNLEPGVFVLPAVTDGMNILYAAGQHDNEITEHLQANGLRPIAIKRNAGTLVTALRVDGRDALLERLVVGVPQG